MTDFSNRTYRNILDTMLSRVPDTLDKREGSVIQTALGPAAWYLEGIYFDLLRMQENVHADSAGGKSLDLKCAEWGLERKKPTYAVKYGTFDVQVPIGSRFSVADVADSPVYVVEGYQGINDAGEFRYTLQCETAGQTGNNCTGKLLAIDYINGLTEAFIAETVTEGTDEEDDDALRKRLLTKIRMPSTSGNIHDYYNWAMACSGVGAAKVFPLANGPGTVKAVIADENKNGATQALVKYVQHYIEDMKPIGATVTVASAVELPVNVTAKIKLSNGLNLGAVQSAFRAALGEFLHDSAFELSYVGYARVGNILLGTAGVEDYAELDINGYSGNVELADEQIAVIGAVTLEVIVT